MTKNRMFLETDKERAKQIEEYCKDNNIKYETKPVHELIHFDMEELTDEQAIMIKKLYKTLDAPAEEVRHRKWDERFHTVGEEIKGEFTGANREEEVDYYER